MDALVGRPIGDTGAVHRQARELYRTRVTLVVVYY